MKKRAKRALKEEEEEEVLCCCEYVNRHGERSHVAACCCDCEDLDDACDRFLKREPQKPESLSHVAAVVSDRIRVPWFWGGARKLDLSIVPPLVLLPALLHLAAFHFLLGVLVLTALPGLVLWYYFFTHRKKGRTLFFLSLALFSLGYMYYLFVSEVFPHGNVGEGELAAVSVGVGLTLLTLIYTKRDPGIVRLDQQAVHSTVTYYSAPPDKDSSFNGGTQEVSMTAVQRIGSLEQEGLELKESGRRNWCSVCRVVRPPRAGHCRICGVCVLRLDHHCVWWVINNCVGQANHVSFLLTLVFFLLTSLYGIGLVLWSVCPQQNVLTALLYCPGVYTQYRLHLAPLFFLFFKNLIYVICCHFEVQVLPELVYNSRQTYSYLLNIVSLYNHKPLCIVSGFYVIYNSTLKFDLYYSQSICRILNKRLQQFCVNLDFG
uniref:Palmitoyltransferase n=1 Tax=Poecilia reticulata TaxID=8081 RepID=A0A3P9Q229_POERE